jgi:hypothetical protein
VLADRWTPDQQRITPKDGALRSIRGVPLNVPQTKKASDPDAFLFVDGMASLLTWQPG